MDDDASAHDASVRLRDDDAIRPLLRAAYPIAVLFVAIPLFDLLSTAWPIQPGNLQWRYGFLGLLANVVLTPMLGAVLAALAAAALGQRGTLRALAVLYLLAALLLLAGLVLFGLDVLQLQREITAQQITNYRAGAAIAVGKYLLTISALVWLGMAGLKTARRLAEPAPTPTARAGARRPD